MSKMGVGSMVNRMIRYRGCYMIAEGANHEQDVVCYSAYNFDKKSIVTSGNKPNFPVLNWVIYNARKSGKKVPFMPDIEVEVKRLLERAGFGEAIPEYIKVSISWVGLYIFCVVRGIEYTHVIFAVRDGRLYYTAVYDKSYNSDIEGVCNIKHMRLDNEVGYDISVPATYRSRCSFNTSFFTMYLLRLGKGYESNLLSYAIKLKNMGISDIEYPCGIDLSNIDLLYHEDSYVYCENLTEDIPDYFESVMSSKYYGKLLEETERCGISGYGINLEDYRNCNVRINYEEVPQYLALKKYEDTLSFDMYIPVGKEECVYLTYGKRSIQRAYIKEVSSITGENLFYSVVGCGLLFKKGTMLNRVDSIFASSRSKNALVKELMNGSLPSGKYLSVKGILIKGIIDEDTELKLVCEFLGRDIEVIYSRISGATVCDSFPNIKGLDCEKFLKAVMRSLGYSSYRDISVFYKVYVKGKYISDKDTLSGCISDYSSARGELVIGRHLISSGEEIKRFKYNKVLRELEEIERQG